MRAPPRLSNRAAPQKTKKVPGLVPTTYVDAFRDIGRYQSTRTLPDLELVLDRSLRQIATSYESRGRSKKSFDALWRKVCKKLLQLKNATAYAHWKIHEDTVRNRHELNAAQIAVGEAWFSVEASEPSQDGSMRVYSRHADDFEELQGRRVNLKPKIRATTDDAIEVAIAYWIEAKNACHAADHLRTLHSLIECQFFLGITFSAKTESESKSEAGRKQGQELRDRMARNAIQVMREIKVDKRMQDQDHLIGMIAQLIEATFPSDFRKARSRYFKRSLQ